jgi:hypothetical protein
VWRLYEGQTRFDDFAQWHVVLYDADTRTMHVLTMSTQAGTSNTSFGNPTAQLEPAPQGEGRVLVITVYIFNSRATSSESGELVYFQPT